jgi:peptidoglycan-associated lipoprotein
MRFLLLAAALLSLAACRPRVRPVPIAPATPVHQPVDGSHVEPDPAPTRRPIIGDPPPPVVVKPPIVRDVAAIVAQANASLVDAYFPDDRAELTRDAMDALRKDAAILLPLLKEFPELEIVVEGHCDERGSAAYNLGLGEQRAGRAAAILETLGLPADGLRTITYGSERPQCDTPAESCWRLNRRAHLELRLRARPSTMPDSPTRS